MTTPAALAGSYADFKLVKTRAVAQLVIEIPIEQAEAAIKMFGIPMAGTEIPVAVALIDITVPAPAMVEAAAMHKKMVALQASERGREAYSAKDAMEQATARACIMCKDLKFQLWAVKSGTVREPETTADWLRRQLGINSRNEISSDFRAFQSFLALETQFKMDTGQLAEMR